MKTTLHNCFLAAACMLALNVFAQGPTATLSPSASVTPGAAVAASPATSASPGQEDDLESRIERKVKKGLHISIGDDRRERERERDRNRDHDHDSDLDELGPLMAIPIVGIIFGTLSLFGTPVLIVAAIMFFSYLRSRSLHRTVRTMVERGQAVPPALFAPPPIVRARSDMRRGVVLVMVGIGLMVFFGAVNDWEGGAWALGIIPFLIGAGYLLVWKLEGNKPNSTKTIADNYPPVS